MKKLIISFSFLAAILLFSFGTQQAVAQGNSGQPNWLVGQAHKAASDCISNFAQLPNTNLVTQVQVVGICNFFNTMYEVTFWHRTVCPNNGQPCPLLVNCLISKVLICDTGEVLQVLCPQFCAL